MRLTLILAATLSLACASMAQAQEQSVPMVSHQDYMIVCAQNYVAQLQARDGTAPNDATRLAVRLVCQCEQEHLPAEGEPVKTAQLDNATQVCGAMADKDAASFSKTYGQHLKDAGDQ